MGFGGYTVMSGMSTLANLGCGDDYKDGYLNVDVDERVDADFHYDLNDTPWRFPDRVPDGHFEFVVMDNVLEHLENQHEIIRELARVTEEGGTVMVAGPHHNSKGAWVDPTHTRPFHPETFDHPLVDELFDVIDVDVNRVRFGRLVPERIAMLAADHVGHIVDGFEVELERTGVAP